MVMSFRNCWKQYCQEAKCGKTSIMRITIKYVELSTCCKCLSPVNLTKRKIKNIKGINI